MGSPVGRERHANTLTMVDVGMGEAKRAHGFPHCHYGIVVLMRQVYNISAERHPHAERRRDSTEIVWLR
jgi:hypothetical protein